MVKKILIISLAIFCLAQVMPAQAATNSPLATRLSGRILLAVQQNGGAWYVDPVNLKRYPLALNIAGTVGIGISNKDLAKIPVAGSTAAGDKNFIARAKGKIFLQVQDRGEAWYINPLDGKRYLFNSSENISSLIKKFGLGISNANLAKITAAPAIKTAVNLNNIAAPISISQPAATSAPYDLTYLEQKINQLVNAERASNSLPSLTWNGDIAAVAREHSQELADENKALTSLNKVCDYFLIHHEGLTGGLYQDSRLASSGIDYFSASGENIAMQGGKQVYFLSTIDSNEQSSADSCQAAVDADNNALKASLESNTISPQAKINLINSEIAKRTLEMAAESPVNVTSISYLTNDQMASYVVTGWMNSPGHRANILQAAYNESGIGVAYVNGYIIATQDFIERVSCGYQGAPCCPTYSCYVPNSCQQDNVCR